MRRLLYLAALAAVASLILAPAALAQVQNPEDCPAGTKPKIDANGAMGSGEFLGCVPVEELCDVNALTPSQYSECIATPEQITGVPAGVPIDTTAGGDQYEPGTGPMIVPSQAAPATTVLPSTGGPALLLPAGGLLLATGLIGIKLARRRS